MVILGSPCSGSKLQGTSPVLSRVTCVGGRGHSQTQYLPPAHRWGHSQTGVYLIFPSPRGRTQLWSGVAPVWTTCTLPGLLCCFHGIWRISQGGSTRCTGAGGAGLAHCAITSPMQESPCRTGREAEPSVGWIHRSTTLGVLCSALKFPDGNWFPAIPSTPYYFYTD